MSTSGESKRYTPYSDLRLYPGIHLSDERRRQLDEDEVEADQLTTDDLFYKLGRMVTGTMYGMMELIEERWGKDAAREVAFEWGRQRARENLKQWLRTRGLKRLTPEIWARFQDYRHIISGPTHSPSFCSYQGESEVVLNRTTCVFHNGRPEGVDSYCAPACDGMFAGYAEACPEFEGGMPVCMSRGTSDSRCQVRFSFSPQE